ncbi:hypothetical protein ACP4OV_004155 [Aristida adscensionis]
MNSAVLVPAGDCGMTGTSALISLSVLKDWAVDMSYDDLEVGGILSQVLQRPQQGALAVLKLLGYCNENHVLDRRAFHRHAGIVGVAMSACRRSEAVLSALQCVPLRSSLHFLGPVVKLPCTVKDV